MRTSRMVLLLVSVAVLAVVAGAVTAYLISSI
jgi:hypothetical protein